MRLKTIATAESATGFREEESQNDYRASRVATAAPQRVMPRKRFIAFAFFALMGIPWLPSKNNPTLANAPVPRNSANAFYSFQAALFKDEIVCYTDPRTPPAKPAGPSFPKAIQDPGGFEAVAEARAHRDKFELHLTLLKQGLKLPMVPDPKSEFRYIYIRELARLSARDGNLKQLDGDYAGAMTAYLDAYALGQQVRGGKTLVAEMIGVLCEGTGVAPADAAVEHLSAADARAALVRLEDMMGKRPTFPELLAVAYAENVNRLRLDTNPELGESIQMLGKIPLIRIANEGLITRFNTRAAEQAALAQKPYQQAKNKLSIRLGDWDPLSLFSFNANRILESYILRTAAARRLLVRLALRAWQKEHQGAFPSSLEALVTDGYLKVLPTDPYSYTATENFHYNQATGKVWSVGPDGINNNGTGDDDLLEFPDYGKRKSR